MFTTLMKLSKDQFKKAKDFIFNKGRTLDQALFKYYFESGRKEVVLRELALFQNDDGGFGKGLESDLRSENSSVIATFHAMHICREIDINYKEYLVKNAVKYLLESYDPEKKVWPIITDAVRDVPHPWWWQGDVEKNFGNFLINPSVEILGALLDYKELVESKFLEDNLQICIDRIETNIKPSVYDIRSCQFLINSKNLDNNVRSHIIEVISPIIKKNIIQNKEKWNGVDFNPTNIIHSPSSPFIDIIGRELLNENLEFDIKNQLEDGSWPLNWSWEEIDPEAWKLADLEWRGHMTLIKLKLFKEFDNIE